MKLIFSSIISFVFIVLCFEDLSAQQNSSYNPQKLYSISQIRQDFEIFQKALEEAHPGLYSHVSKEKVNKKFSEASKSLTHDMTELQFIKIITSVTSFIRDGHTASLPSDNFMRFFKTSAKILPLKVYYLNHNLYILYSPNNILPKGSQIISINGKPVNEIISDIFSHLPSDGTMQTGKQWLLNQQFSYYYYALIEQTKKFFIEYATADNVERKNILISASSANKDSVVVMPFFPPKDIYYLLRFIDNNIALLTIRCFLDDEAAKLDFSRFIDSAFKEIKNKGSKNLIIDLRGNRGGEDQYGALLYSYLTNKDFHYFREIVTVTDSISFGRYTDTDSSFNREMHESLNKLNPHLYEMKTNIDQQLLPQKCQKNPFLGSVYFLIDGGSFSTTADLCTIVRSNKRGKFIGEETGGNAIGNCSGQIVRVTLPNTKIKVILPLWKYKDAVSPNTNKNRGIIPNYSFTPSIEDIISNHDSMLNYTMELISDNKTK